MDLLGTLEAARNLRDFAREVRRSPAPWENDEGEFLAHFGVPFEAYAEIVNRLDEQQNALLKATIDVNPEAAVLWILAMEEIEGWIAG